MTSPADRGAPALARWLPPGPAPLLGRNGYALTADLEDASYAEVVSAMERFQADFLALTRTIWTPEFPISGDSLSHFSRQWEYPYAWSNLHGRPPARVLDAGSGITFFPFLLGAAGHEVHCCDDADDLGLAERYAVAVAATGCPVLFRKASLTDLPYPSGFFDVVTCLSVLEHVGATFRDIVRSLARVVRPGGRLVLTVDVSLRRDTAMLLEDVGVLLAELDESFTPAFSVDLRRPPGLLTSEGCLDGSAWRLPWPWQPAPGPARSPGAGHAVNGVFRSIAVLGLTFDRLSAT